MKKSEDRESTTTVQCETHHRESCSQSRSIQEPTHLSSRGKQMVSITANIENETAEVESISSDMASERQTASVNGSILAKRKSTHGT